MLEKTLRDCVSSLVQMGFAKALVLPQLMQSFSDDRTRTISWIALNNPVLPGAALVGSLPHENGGSKSILAVPPHHQVRSPGPGSRPCRSRED